jgi:hypothetical protein
MAEVVAVDALFDCELVLVSADTPPPPPPPPQATTKAVEAASAASLANTRIENSIKNYKSILQRSAKL